MPTLQETIAKNNLTQSKQHTNELTGADQLTKSLMNANNNNSARFIIPQKRQSYSGSDLSIGINMLLDGLNSPNRRAREKYKHQH